jgi:hypothetical protein
VTSGGGTGATSTTCRRSRPDSAPPVSDFSHPEQCSGSITTTRSGSSSRLRDDEDAPGCLPGWRPDRVREERLFAGFFSHGASEDGGREEFDESSDSRRVNSAV